MFGSSWVILLLLLLVVVVQSIKVVARSPMLHTLFTQSRENGVQIVHAETFVFVDISFYDSAVHRLYLFPPEKGSILVYDYDGDNPRRSFWMLVLLASTDNPRPAADWLEDTDFADQTEGEVEAWLMARNEHDEYHVAVVEIIYGGQNIIRVDGAPAEMPQLDIILLADINQ